MANGSPITAPPPKSLQDVTHGLAYVHGNVLVADAAGIVRYVNAQTLAALGYDRAEMIGVPITSFWDHPEETSRDIMARLERDRFWQGQIKLKPKNRNDERDRWEQVTLSIVSGVAAGQAFIVNIGQPIDSGQHDALEARLRQSERAVADLTKTQQALEQSELLYRTLMDAAPENIVLTRLVDGKIVHANPAFYQRSGWGPEECLGRTTLELNIYVNPQDRDRFVALLKRDGRVEGFQVPVHFKDGVPSVEMWSARVIELFGEPHLLVVTRDIGELIATRKALEESERGYRTILESSPNAVAVTRLSDSRFVLVNDAFARDSGYGREELIGRRVQELNLFEDRADRERFFETISSQGRVDGMELRFRTKDGRIAESLVSARTIRFGNEPCILVLSTNIDTLKATQRALSEREANYRTILATAPYAIMVTRLQDGKYLEVNDACCRTTGYSREEFIGKTALELKVYKNDHDRETMLDALRRDGRVYGMEFEFRSKDGRLVDYLFSTTPFTYQGEACLLSMTVDISRQKAAETALRRSEQKYRNVLMNMEEGYWEADLKGNFIFVNDAECRIRRRPADKLLGKNYGDDTAPETTEKILQTFDAVLRTGVPALLQDYELLRADGASAVIESSVSLQKDENGRPIGFFGISRDITEKQKAANELEKHRRHLEEMVRERTQALASAQNELVKREKLSVLGQLTATVSHELRNPLGVIRASNFYLHRKIGGGDPMLEKHFKRIEEQVTLCDLIVADLLEYTRGRSVALEHGPITPWLEKLFDQLAEEQNIPIETHFSETLPPIPHDQEKMRRVFINLTENAVYAVKAQAEAQAKAGQSYQPMIHVTATQADGMVAIEVRDNGIGMDEATRQHAFEPLFTTRARGTGLGLANVQKIVAEHNGEVSLVSEPGKGTTVTVLLPCKVDAK
ncbi:MAG: PAS domain S-box protein [Desulfobacterales bacterium]|nr:PAS domain S-box protein [Desulfobacterales bacterium]